MCSESVLMFKVSTFLNKGKYCSHWLVVSIKINIPLGKKTKDSKQSREKREESSRSSCGDYY